MLQGKTTPFGKSGSRGLYSMTPRRRKCWVLLSHGLILSAMSLKTIEKKSMYRLLVYMTLVPSFLLDLISAPIYKKLWEVVEKGSICVRSLPTSRG